MTTPSLRLHGVGKMIQRDTSNIWDLPIDSHNIADCCGIKLVFFFSNIVNRVTWWKGEQIWCWRCWQRWVKIDHRDPYKKKWTHHIILDLRWTVARVQYTHERYQNVSLLKFEQWIDPSLPSVQLINSNNCCLTICKNTRGLTRFCSPFHLRLPNILCRIHQDEAS